MGSGLGGLAALPHQRQQLAGERGLDLINLARSPQEGVVGYPSRAVGLGLRWTAEWGMEYDFGTLVKTIEPESLALPIPIPTVR